MTTDNAVCPRIDPAARLRRAIRLLVRAEIAYSWMGGCDPESWDEIRRNRNDARARFRRAWADAFPGHTP